MTTTQKLIEKAYRLSGAYTADRIRDGSRQNEALELLNDILDANSVTTSLIPYYSDIQFQLVSGKGKYRIGEGEVDVISNKPLKLGYVRITDSSTTFYVNITDDSNYYNLSGDLQSTGRPSICFLHKYGSFSEITFFRIPDSNYTCDIRAKLEFSHVSLNSEIIGLPSYYLQYLKYALAKEIALIYDSKMWDISKENALNTIRNRVQEESEQSFVYDKPLNSMWSAGTIWSR